ncbi:hypothetical protein KW795_00880 [Candidatus Microgenomates bacterium]|nr:hypothetical protein [Candidatus Microgenomates bacterium]
MSIDRQTDLNPYRASESHTNLMNYIVRKGWPIIPSPRRVESEFNKEGNLVIPTVEVKTTQLNIYNIGPFAKIAKETGIIDEDINIEGVLLAATEINPVGALRGKRNIRSEIIQVNLATTKLLYSLDFEKVVDRDTQELTLIEMRGRIINRRIDVVDQRLTNKFIKQKSLKLFDFWTNLDTFLKR